MASKKHIHKWVGMVFWMDVEPDFTIRKGAKKRLYCFRCKRFKKDSQ